MTGYQKLKESVERDIEKRNMAATECWDKFNWIIDRAKHYEEKLGVKWEDVLDSWEKDRNYWYMNYYQDCNQPKIEAGKVRVFETTNDLIKSVGDKKFRCPACGGVSTNPYECDSGLEIGKNKICDWKVYGFFKDLGKGIFVYCKDELKGETIFMPVEWEKDYKEN